jgi:hypothetical protein
VSAILLANVNVWLDIIFVTLEILVFTVFFVVHLGVSIPTGRFKKQWIDKQWPKHDWAPPALPKFIHFQHLAMMLLLGFSGMYIRFPFFEGGREAMRYVHYVAMVIVGLNFFWRLWYAFFSKERDWKEFAVGKKDLATLLGVAAYYTYFSNDKPHVAKYNVMQKPRASLALRSSRSRSSSARVRVSCSSAGGSGRLSAARRWRARGSASCTTPSTGSSSS